MKKNLFILFLSLTGLISAQSNYQLLIKGSENEPVMSAVYSPDGNNIAYTKSNYKGIWVYNLQSNKTTMITEEDASGFAFQWSSDSKSILTRVAKYENNRRYNAVKVFDINTKESKQLSEYKTMMPYLPQWADGDTKIILPEKTKDEIFITDKSKNNSSQVSSTVFEKNNKLTVKNFADNSEKTFEPVIDAQYINISSSPDNTKLVFEIVGGNIYVMNLDGTNLIDLGKGNRPHWSSISDRIIYIITKDNGQEITESDIFIINADGTERRNITNTVDKIEMNPYFAPDGKSIVFDVVNDGSIYLMNIE